MERRKFLQNIGLSSAVLPLYSFTSKDVSPNRFLQNKKIIPKSLQEGDTIGIISPSGAIYENEPYEIAKESLEAMGLRVKFGKFIRSRYGHLAGTDKERATELNEMFKNSEIDAIIALRGGSGAARILDLLDYKAIANNPKIFIGYSDITALHIAIYQKTGLVTFHAPLAVSTWNRFSASHFKSIIFNKETPLLENPKSIGDNLTQTTNRTRTIRNGKVSGNLLGGNLSVLTGIMGSEYFPTDWSDKILYIEDVGEKIYAVDRMMTQLQLGGVLKQIKGFIFGKCTDCKPGGSDYGSLTLDEVIDHYIKPLRIPAFSGAMIGHIDDNLTIPNSINVEIDANNGSIQLLEAAVK